MILGSIHPNKAEIAGGKTPLTIENVVGELVAHDCRNGTQLWICMSSVSNVHWKHAVEEIKTYSR